MARKHTEDEVLKALRKKNDVRVDNRSFTIYMLSNTVWSKEKKKAIPNPRKINDIGNGTWGKLDYLVKYQGYSLVKTDKF